MWVYALDLFVLQLPSTTLRIHIIILIFHKRKLAQRRRAQRRSRRVWVEWGVSSGLSSLLILGTFQSPVCIPLHPFLLTTEKLQSLSNKPGPLWQSPKPSWVLRLPECPSYPSLAHSLRTSPSWTPGNLSHPQQQLPGCGAPSPVSGVGEGPESWDWRRRPAGVVGFPLGGKPVPTPLPAPVPARASPPRALQWGTLLSGG